MTTLPRWMADLPRMAGFPNLVAPSDAVWGSGKPLSAGGDQRKTCALGTRRRCRHCGYPISTPSYVIVNESAIADGFFASYPGGLHAQSEAPLHRSCAFYAAMVCPFLRHESTRRMTESRTQRGKARVVGYSNYGIFIPPGNDPVSFGFVGIAEAIDLANRADVAEHFAAAVASDAELNFTTTQRLYWTDSPDDERRLSEIAEDDKQIWAAASRTITNVGGHRYRLHLLASPAPAAPD
jgi:hypothetical protein